MHRIGVVKASGWISFVRLLIETRQWQAAARGDTSLTRQHPRDDGSGPARRDSGLHTATRHTALSVLSPRTTPSCRRVFGRPPSATRLLFLIVGIFVDANRFGDGVMAPRSAAEYNTGPRCESGGAPRISLVLFFPPACDYRRLTRNLENTDRRAHVCASFNLVAATLTPTAWNTGWSPTDLVPAVEPFVLSLCVCVCQSIVCSPLRVSE